MFVGAAGRFDVRVGAMVPACPPLVVVVVFCWFVFWIFEFELLKLVPFEVVPPFRVLAPPLTFPAPVNPTGLPPVPLALLTTSTHAGMPDVPMPGSVPGGHVMVEFEVVLKPVVPVELPAVLLPELPFTACDTTVGVGTVVNCADRKDVSVVTPWKLPKALLMLA